MNSFVRNLTLLNAYFIKQLPAELQARMHPNELVPAFSFIGEDGERHRTDAWASAPTGYCRRHENEGEDQDASMTSEDREAHDRRVHCLRKWAEYSTACGRFLGGNEDLLDLALGDGSPSKQRRKPTTAGKFLKVSTWITNLYSA